MTGTVTRTAIRAVLPALLVVLFTGVLSGQVHRAAAPGFTLALLDGKTLSLAELKGSPVVLLFWAPW